MELRKIEKATFEIYSDQLLKKAQGACCSRRVPSISIRVGDCSFRLDSRGKKQIFPWKIFPDRAEFQSQLMD